MNKVFTIIFIILLIPALVYAVNAEMLEIDVGVNDMDEIEESKFRASGVSVIRNSSGELIGLAKVDATEYLDDPIIDTYLDDENPNVNLVEKGTIGTNTISHYRSEVLYYNPICAVETLNVPGFYDRCNWYHRAFNTIFGLTHEGVNYQIFSGLNHSFLVKSGYEVTTYWDIFSRD